MYSAIKGFVKKIKRAGFKELYSLSDSCTELCRSTKYKNMYDSGAFSHILCLFVISQLPRSGKDQEKAQLEKKIPTPKTEVGKNQTNNHVLIP